MKNQLWARLALLCSLACTTLPFSAAHADSEEASSDQFVLFFKTRIQSVGQGRFSEEAEQDFDVKYAAELAAFSSKCRSEVTPYRWQDAVRVTHEVYLQLNESARTWYKQDAGSLYCYGVTH